MDSAIGQVQRRRQHMAGRAGELKAFSWHGGLLS
jgi:hypothetical protein